MPTLTDRTIDTDRAREIAGHVYRDVMVCTDCYQVHHFGEPSPHECSAIDGETDPSECDGCKRTLECVAAYDALGGDQYVTDNTNSETGDGIETFSWSACHCCTSGLGGSRYRLQVEAH